MSSLLRRILSALSIAGAVVLSSGSCPLHAAGTWSFEPGEDPFTAEAWLDLRSLNEETAGQSGFIQLSEDGMSFVRGNGQPIRFWSVVSSGHRMSPEEMETHCRFLAKRGVNMIRLHTQISDHSDGARMTDVRDEVIDGIQRLVATAKEYGIYTTISPFWAHSGPPDSWEMEGGYDRLWGLMFFDERLQGAYKAWVRELYTRDNPYTGVPLKDEPAVGIVQIKNEDSLLFWTFQDIQDPYRGHLRQKFAEWLTEEYGSPAAAVEAWGGLTHERDNLEKPEVGLYQTWDLTQPATGLKAQRVKDQLRFIAELQHGFYEEIGRYYREDLGCRQLINAMNWKSADPVLLSDVERWTYTANDVIAVNRYTGVIHVGTNNGYRIDPGHHFKSVSVLKNPETFPGALKQVVGYPFIITETAWVHPARYQTEGPFLAAAYMSLTGVDSFYWFHAGEPTWLLDPRRMFWQVGDSYALHKWSGSVPQQIGQFPAYALAFRKGYVRHATDPVVHEERSMESLWERDVPIISEAGTYDPNRDPGDFAPDSAVKQDVDRLAFFVGPVEVKYGGDPEKTVVADLQSYIDHEQSQVRSITGELTLNYGTGVCTVDSPAFQGVTGFLSEAGGKFQFSSATIESANEYATIALVSMDGESLAESARILVQVGTVARLGGWVAEDATFSASEGEQSEEITGKKIVNTGSPPWQIENTQASISLKNSSIKRAVLLDVNGYAEQEIPVERDGDSVHLTLPEMTMYLVLTAEQDAE